VIQVHLGELAMRPQCPSRLLLGLHNPTTQPERAVCKLR
jgi:hypothetical protein